MNDWVFAGMITVLVSLVVLWAYVGYKLSMLDDEITYLKRYHKDLHDKVRKDHYRVARLEDDLKIPITIHHENGNKEALFFKLSTLVNMLMEEYQVSVQAEYILQHKALEVIKESSREFREANEQ